MSADTPDSWRLTLPCTRAEAEAIDAAEAGAIDAVLMTSETIEDDREHWRLDAYFECEPGDAEIAAIHALVPSAAGLAPQIVPLSAADWVAMSQAGLEPIRAGRFVVHTSAHVAEPPPGGRAFRIDAGAAFGTGHHATTAGCLAMLDRHAPAGVTRAIDIGTGTGILAFAIRHLWPDAAVTATDIDRAAIVVARDNMAANGVGRIALIVADGALDPAITAGAPYDLVVANVLAGPLVSMASELAAIAAPGATLILAGLLDTQRDEVVAAYEACGAALAEADRRGDWTVLRLTAAATPHVPLSPPDPRGRDGWALDL